LIKFRSIQGKTLPHRFTKEKCFPPGDSILAKIMTTKEVSKYLRLHEITICKYAAQGKIPAIRIGRVWRFDKDVIDRWIAGLQKESHTNDNSVRGGGQREPGKKRPRKRKG